MAILEKEVWVGVAGNSSEYYEKLGYSVPRLINKRGKMRIKKGTKVLVEVEHLTKRSNTKVTKICDDCGKKSVTFYNLINKSRENGDGKDRCVTCGNKYRLNNFKIQYEKSLANTHPNITELLLKKSTGTCLSHGSHKKEKFKCNECGNVEQRIVANVVRQGFSCSICSDCIPYPEKFMNSVLKQLNVEYETHKRFDWSEGRIYDFYLEDKKMIIETHGKQHYNGGFNTYGGRTLNEEKDNDRYKEKIAKENGIEYYITIDCGLSEMNYIKKNISVSKLGLLFELKRVNWLKCHEFACKSIIKVASDLWNEGNSIKEILDIINVNSTTTIRRYLKQGSEIGWCDYCGQEEARKIQKGRRRKIIQLGNGLEFIKEWCSIANASISLSISKDTISRCCKGVNQTAGGFKWMYKEDYEKYIEQQKQIS